jgi:hypothetical protein
MQFRHRNPYSGESHFDDLSTFKGTRHPAGVIYCMRQPREAAAIIVSQDGHLTWSSRIARVRSRCSAATSTRSAGAERFPTRASARIGALAIAMGSKGMVVATTADECASSSPWSVSAPCSAWCASRRTSWCRCCSH